MTRTFSYPYSSTIINTWSNELSVESTYECGESESTIIGHCRNVRGLGKSMVVFRLFEKLRCSNERSTKFESLYHE